MADRYLITAADNTYTGEAADIWHANPNQAAGDEGGFTEAADDAKLDANSGNFTLGVAMACINFNATGFSGTIALGANALDVNGAALLLAGTVTGSGNISSTGAVTLAAGTDMSGWTGVLLSDGAAGTYALTTNAVTIPALTINNAGVDGFGLADNLTMGALTYTAGKFTTTARTITLKAGTHDVGWNTSSYPLAHCIIPDESKAELTDRLQFSEITFGTGVSGACVASAAAKLMIFYCTGDDKWHQTVASGTVVADGLNIQLSGGNYQVGYLDGSNLTNGVQVFASAANRTLTMTDDWTVGNKVLNIFGAAAPLVQSLDANGHDLTAGAYTLGGTADDDKSGVLDCGTGAIGMASLAAGHATGNLKNALDFATSTITLSGTLNGANIACTNTGGLVIGGALQNVSVVGTVPLLRRLPGADRAITNVICPSWRRRIRKAQRAA